MRLLLLCLAVLAALPARAQDHLVLQLRWLHQPQFAGYYMAKHLGYYQEAGLDVEIRAGGPSRFPVDEVTEGRAHYGVGNTEVFVRWASGAPLKALAALYQHSPSVLLARADSGIKTLSDLPGKKVMFFPGDLDPELIAMLRKSGIEPDSFQHLGTSTDVRDLIEGRVDAFNAYLTNEPFYLQELGIPVTILDPRAQDLDFYSDILFTTERELERHPLRAQRFLQASLRGWEYAVDHPEETLDIISEYYGVTKTREHMRFELNMARQLIMPELVSLGHVSERRWRRIADILTQTGQLPPIADVSAFLHRPGHLNERPWLPWLSSAVLALLGGLLLWLLSRQHGALQVTRRRLEHAQEKLGNDVITGLWTRSRLFTELAMRQSQPQPPEASLVVLHLDNLRELNLDFGYGQGDQMLQALAQELNKELLAEDIMARGDGARLLLYLPRSNHPHPDSFAQAVCEQLGKRLTPRLRLSAGVMALQPGQPLEKLLALAEEERLRTASRGEQALIN
ncbi:ABC transporter substrate-binding protein [Gallaecimonas sp. GXIMD4217]|uniref:ABC transporter substrate-binding protein n=1 Tax=Gallaecimonas sp. GXIMD4217 TaxID=3131927 RepID=UPI00311AEF84